MTRPILEQEQIGTLESHLDISRQAFQIFEYSPTYPNALFAHGVYNVFKESIGFVINAVDPKSVEQEGFMDWKPFPEEKNPLNDYILEYVVGGAYLASKKATLHGESRPTKQDWQIQDLQEAIKGENDMKFSQIYGITKNLTDSGSGYAVMEELESLREQYQKS